MRQRVQFVVGGRTRLNEGRHAIGTAGTRRPAPQQKALAPERIASVHGRTATIDEFRSAVEGKPVTSQAPKLP